MQDDLYRRTDTDPTVRKYVYEDAKELLDTIQDIGYSDMTAKVVSIRSKENLDTGETVTDVIIHFINEDGTLGDDFPVEYIETPDGDIYMSGSINEMAESLQDRIEHPEIYASTSNKHKTKITAAIGDEDDELNEPTPGEVVVDDTDTFADTIDDIADTVDDMQDTLDEEMYDEDEDGIGIEMDNNISGHYIAECDRCKGIFISAVIESDQEIDKISGVCPLCDKDTEQHLKWVIKDIDEKENH